MSFSAGIEAAQPAATFTPRGQERILSVHSAFTTVRDYILANSATFIQDDSGVPLQYYSPKKWRFFPFGRYNGPISEFPGRYQEILRGTVQAGGADGFRHRLSLAHQ